jgi:hypothetical protein
MNSLPEWPKWSPNYVQWLQDERHAYRMRTDALRELATRWRKHMRHVVTEDELAEADQLLAASDRVFGACEREEGK